MVNVLVVDDSAFVRNAFAQMLGSDPNIKVVGTARNGEEALEQIAKVNPDVVTLDVEMPKMDGLEALRRIMANSPRPVIMVSSVTTKGAETTLKALEIGAVDFISKFDPGSTTFNFEEMQRELCSKIKSVSDRKHFMAMRQPKSPVAPVPEKTPARILPPVTRTSAPRRECIAIGVSTGGPPAVQKVLTALPEKFPGYILIAQHMPASFTGPFASRLDSLCNIRVKEAESGEQPVAGTAYVCPGGKHLRLEMRGPLPCISVTAEPLEALYKPSANVLMETVSRVHGARALGVMMTGMGNDGVEGTKILKQNGGYMLAQNEASCVVYGMPKAVVDARLADEVVELDKLADAMFDAMFR
jgi:two-component system chemotaxis response regulator CheB